MLDFLMISTRSKKNGIIEVYPKFIIKKSNDLMIRGGDFYAIWIEDEQRWSTDEQDALALIDNETAKYLKESLGNVEGIAKPLYMWDAESGMVDIWHKYCQKQMRDNYHMLDEKLMFSNDKTTKKDYSSKRLNYPLEKGDISAYDKLMSVLYSEEERQKIEWAIGSIVTGDSKSIQKFLVLYGSAGTGKSTVLNIIQKLFEGYYSVFDAKALGSANNSFALEAFKSNPLVAIQHDGDLSRIEDNTRLNSLVSHEIMTVNEKFKAAYSTRFKAFLFMGTNKPVKITDGRSGLIRRLIDVSPTGEKLSFREYRRLIKQIDFELGAIAYHCKEVYQSNPGKYDNYIPISMLGASNDFYNFVEDAYLLYSTDNGTSLKSAWASYKIYCEDANVSYPFSQRVFKEELKNYFKEFKERYTLPDGTRVRNYYLGFRTEKFESIISNPENKDNEAIIFEETESIFDKDCADYPAQYAKENGAPLKKWDDVDTKLRHLDTTKLHYVRVPENHIVIDFDIKNDKGEKDYKLNLEEASKWPPTYAELSKSGAGIHLHYIYQGDPNKLSRIYDDNIEIKVFTGKSSLRRKLTKCNKLPIASINTGLPLKGEKKVINIENVKSEKSLRTLIKRNLNKEIHPGTKPSMDFIFKILEDAYASGLKYDISDMRNAILVFASNSSHHADYCLKLINNMKFKSDETSETIKNDDAQIMFYDVEVFPNLFIVCCKLQGENEKVVKMINPSPQQVEELVTNFRLVGFNCRRYDNHILYARLMGYNNEQLYTVSQRIISGEKNAFFGEAYNGISYTDVYDFCSKKQSLKKWEIELGIHHQELGWPWDKPIPKDMWEKAADYCSNDVIATEAVFNARQADFIAREILADVAEGSVNDTTNQLTAKIIFGNNRSPQDEFNYRDLGDMSGNNHRVIFTDNGQEVYGNYLEGEYTIFNDKNQAIFPGYKYELGKAVYRGIEPGDGGMVYAVPGMYVDVDTFDVASMHPSSIEAEQLFGERYTKRFSEIKQARIAIKHKDFELAKTLLDGKLTKYLNDESQADNLAQALKIAINSVYGLTAASFNNPFRDIRNTDNIVAKRGALFMINLMFEVEKRGFKVIHIKTDSIKISNTTKELRDFIMNYGKLYGYTFEHESNYERMCLVNNAVFIAKYSSKDICQKKFGYIPDKNAKHELEWTATGAQFAVPYVFKKLFSHETMVFNDFCETKSVSKGDIYLDMNENYPDKTSEEKELKKWQSLARKKDYSKYSEEEIETAINNLTKSIAEGHNYIFVGRVGQFCPIKPGCNGGVLYRKDNGKYYAVTGTTGYRWLESEMVKNLGKEDDINEQYYISLVNDAIKAISEFGDYEWFVSDDTEKLKSDPLPF